jgi:hypothetical protein
MNVETTEILTAPTATAKDLELARLRAAVTDAHARGFHTLTCEPSEKRPWNRYSPHAYNSATTDTAVALKPYDDGQPANYGVSGKHSNLVILDIDRGFSCEADFNAWMEKHELPATYTVRSGKRVHKDGSPAFAVHLYYAGQVKDTALPFSDVSGEIKSEGGYVIGANSVHPDSGAHYEILRDLPVTPFPDSVKSLLGKPQGVKPQPSGIVISRNQKIPEGERWKTLQRKAGALRNVGLNEDAIYNALKSYALDQYTDGEDFIVTREADIRENAHAAYTKFEKTPEPAPWKTQRMSHADLLAEAEKYAGQPDVVQGMTKRQTVNAAIGDSGIGKTPYLIQKGLCIAFGLPFVGHQTTRGRFLMADYENHTGTKDFVNSLAKFLGIPTPLNPEWFAYLRDLSQEELTTEVQDFKPSYVLIDALRGFNAKAELDPVECSKMIAGLQKTALENDTAFEILHHPRKQDRKLKPEEKPNLFDLTKPVKGWLEEAAGTRALINQTHSRFGFAKPDKDNAELGTRGLIKGYGDTGLVYLDREYDETGLPAGYSRVTGEDQLSPEDRKLLASIHHGQPLHFSEALKLVHNGDEKKRKSFSEFLKRAVGAGVLIPNGKDSTPSKTYTRIKETK